MKIFYTGKILHHGNLIDVRLEDWSDKNTPEFPNLYGMTIGAYPIAQADSAFIRRGERFRLSIPHNPYTGFTGDKIWDAAQDLIHGRITLESLAPYFHNGEKDRILLGMVERDEAVTNHEHLQRLGLNDAAALLSAPTIGLKKTDFDSVCAWLNSPTSYTWDELYEFADGSAFGDPELTAKDEARFQLRELILKEIGVDIESDKVESAEEEIDYFCADHHVFFDRHGNIVDDGRGHP